MVKALHAAGLEVILDVVYNHTAEGDERGPTLSFRGIGNAAYYKLASDRRRYADYTGTGNTLDLSHPHVLQLVMDSLRYWVQEMHVDGFRFDLASALARSLHDVDMLSGFLTTIQQDPLLSQVKLIAEPWDVGAGGYQVGEFPPLWSEWNDQYRDTVRDFWRGRSGGVRALGYRLSGSSDLYGDDGRRPFSSVNFVTAHDGFTLRDLVTYDRKHNEANGEHNRDGSDHNRSWNHGVEGETPDPEIEASRRRTMRSLLATLVLSTGVPMITAGDEMGRTQGGNNNAYCQDDEVSWVDWDLAAWQRDLLEFAQLLVRLRREHPVLRHRHFFEGRAAVPGGPKDLAWFAPDGSEVNEDLWWSPGHADRRDVPRGRRTQITDVTGRAHHRRLVPAAPARRRGGGRVRAARDALGRALRATAGHRRRASPPRRLGGQPRRCRRARLSIPGAPEGGPARRLGVVHDASVDRPGRRPLPDHGLPLCTVTPARRTSVPNRNEFGISAISSTRRTRSRRASSVASPATSTL